MSEREDSVRKGTIAAGLSAFGALMTGVVGLLGGIALFDEGGGMYLMTSAVAFGLLANAVFRR